MNTIDIKSIIFLVFIFQLGYLLITSLKKIIATIFLAEDYEIYLSLPIKLRDIFISKLFKINIDILSESFFILLSILSLLTLYGVKPYMYPIAIIIFFINNFLFTLYVYIGSIIYLRLNRNFKYILLTIVFTLFALSISEFKLELINFLLLKLFLLDILLNSSNLILGVLIYIFISISVLLLGFMVLFSGYKEIIFNLDNSKKFSFGSANKETKFKSIIKALVYKDLKKVWRNSTFKQSLIIGNGIFIMFFVTMYSLLIPNLTDKKTTIIFFIALTNALPYVASISSGIIQNLISLDGQDLELIYSLPISPYNLLKSKIISALIISLPLIISSLTLNTIFYKKSLLLIILSLISTLLTYVTAIIISLYSDSKKPNFLWFSSKELVDDYEKTFKLIGFSIIVTIPFYILNIIFNENYLILLTPSFINLYYLIDNYKHLKMRILELSIKS